MVDSNSLERLFFDYTERQEKKKQNIFLRREEFKYVFRLKRIKHNFIVFIC
jgi:hypothetical protein